MQLNLRKHLESSVVATNKRLKDEVTKMDLISLLRNCHPLYRHDYAKLLYHDGLITENQLKEFT
jgi:hypothetical protein